MRELTGNEIFEVGGGITFTTPITMTLLNNVADATVVGRWAALSFSAGYYIGTKLNEKFNLSGKLVDLLP